MKVDIGHVIIALALAVGVQVAAQLVLNKIEKGQWVPK